VLIYEYSFIKDLRKRFAKKLIPAIFPKIMQNFFKPIDDVFKKLVGKEMQKGYDLHFYDKKISPIKP